MSARCKPGTACEYRRSVELFIKPRIGGRTVAEIQRSDTAEMHHGMRKTSYQAGRTPGVPCKTFNPSVLWGLRPEAPNPCPHATRFKEQERERSLSAEWCQRLGRVLDDILEDCSETRLAVAAIR